MDIREALRTEHSKRQTMAIVEYVGTDAARFRELMRIFFESEYRLTQRAAWPMNYCAERHPELIKPYLNKLVDLLERKDGHDALRRNIARLLQYVEIPKRMRGRVFDACLTLVEDSDQPVAVKVFAMTVAAQIADGETALINELRLLVDKHSAHTTVAFRKRVELVLFGK